MGSTDNTNPWGQYDSYKDCSQGVCSVYCPQWCYIIFPPPPSFFLDNDGDDDSSSSDFSPLLIALIGILASAFILVTYYTLISKYCNRRHSSTTSAAITRDRSISSSAVNDTWQESNGAPVGNGLDESLIKSITVYKYKKEDGFVECSDCSVCLSEFQEGESLRLLPKCNHAFHVACIDTWLKSHSNCPLCRSFIPGNDISTPFESVVEISTQVNSNSTDLNHSVVVNLDLETRPGDVVLIADILREIEDDEGDEESTGVGTSSLRVEDGEGEKTPTAANQTGGISNFLSRSSTAVKKSVSAGKFTLSSYRLPN